jgi:hypothetical protein
VCTEKDSRKPHLEDLRPAQHPSEAVDGRAVRTEHAECLASAGFERVDRDVDETGQEVGLGMSDAKESSLVKEERRSTRAD